MNQKGGYPFWFDDVPKGMSRAQYMRLSKSKPKNKSMKVWIKENKKNMTKYTKKRKNLKRSIRHKRKSRKRSQKGGALCPLCIPAAGAVYLAYKNYSEKTVNAKMSVKRDEAYEMKKDNGKVIREKFSQRGLKLNLNGKKKTCKNLKEAKRTFNKAVKECIQSGFTKC